MEDMDDDDWNEFQDGQFDQYRDPENEELEDAESEREEEDSDIYSDDELGLSPLSLDVKKLVLKLDAILQLLLTQIKTSLTTTESSDNFLCHTFMVLFESLILPTHRIRCTQFLIFYTCSLDSAFSDDFMGLLAGKIFELNQPTGTRISAASYFASYVARAKYVDSKAVKTCQKLLVQYATSYLDKNEAQVSQKSIGKHGIFYAVVQAILYIFCFRWRDFIQSEEEEEVVVVQASLPSEMTGFQRILTSKLSPLKVCSTHIVDEFARITCSLNMLYCYPFMTKDASSNWRLTNDDNTINTDSTTLHTPTKGSSQELSTLILDRLDTFFPFDPLTLPQSKRFMDGLYQEWTGPTDDESDDGESKSDEDDDDGETEGEEVMAMSYTLTSTSIE